MSMIVVSNWTTEVPRRIARGYLICHINLQSFIIYLFSIVCGLATDIISVHVLIIQSLIVATDEFADKQTFYWLQHENYL